jgi:hypothetical protein
VRVVGFPGKACRVRGHRPGLPPQKCKKGKAGIATCAWSGSSARPRNALIIAPEDGLIGSCFWERALPHGPPSLKGGGRGGTNFLKPPSLCPLPGARARSSAHTPRNPLGQPRESSFVNAKSLGNSSPK